MTETTLVQGDLQNATRMFAADLHHPGGRNEEIERFFLEIPDSVQSIFLLGDIFDYWVNDPDFIEERYGAFLQLLRKMAAGGIDIFFVEGNRDFLASHYFEDEPWIHVLPNPSIIDIDGRTAYIGHGDELCWNDYMYQAYKAVIRSRIVRAIADHLPGHWKQRIAARMAEKSTQLTRKSTRSALRVPPRAYRYMIRTGMDVIIHGHLHDTYQRNIESDGRSGVVLAFGWQEGRRNLIML